MSIIGPATRDESKEMRIYYVIYSFDLTRDAEHMLAWLDPNKIPRGGAGPSLDGVWIETEGDEQYDFDYLADEIESGRPCSNCNGEGTEEQWAPGPGYVRLREGPLPACPGCEGTGKETSRYRKGWHRKYVAELNHAQFLALAEDRCWDLDDDDRPTNYEDTMGSITEYGHLPAISIDDTEGWSYGGEIIYASFYVTTGEIPMGATSNLHESESDR